MLRSYHGGPPPPTWADYFAREAGFHGAESWAIFEAARVSTVCHRLAVTTARRPGVSRCSMSERIRVASVIGKDSEPGQPFVYGIMPVVQGFVQ